MPLNLTEFPRNEFLTNYDSTLSSEGLSITTQGKDSVDFSFSKGKGILDLGLGACVDFSTNAVKSFLLMLVFMNY